MVSIENFSKLLEWFGPLTSNIIPRIKDIVSQVWFHGNLSHIQAERMISKKPNLKKGTFLIRYWNFFFFILSWYCLVLAQKIEVILRLPY